MATKSEKKRALKEAFKQAKEAIKYYQSFTLEELEKSDIGDLSLCLGVMFGWINDQNGDTEEAKENIIQALNEQARERKGDK